MRPPGPPKQLEKRRRHAVQLLESGRTLSAVARQVGAAVSSVFRWWQGDQRKGAPGVAGKAHPRPLRAAYRTDLWTLPRVADLIHQQFGVRYHPAHVWKVLTALGWSCQKPERRAVERDEAAIARWTREDWPRIKKRRATWRPSRLRRR